MNFLQQWYQKWCSQRRGRRFDRVWKERRESLHTLDDVVADIVARHLPDESRIAILKMETPDEMSALHHTAGMSLRNGLGLWKEDSTLSRYFQGRFGVYHADDMSGMIFEALWHRVHGIPYDPHPTVERYRKHWADYGLNLDQTTMVSR
jgi:hypothetical protein